MLRILIIIFVADVLVCAWLTRYVRDFARSRDWVDQPDTNRHLHRRPVPRLGGVPIFLTFVSTVVTLLVLQRWFNLSAFSIRVALPILGCASLIFLTGLYDDFRSLGPYSKFGIQVVAASFLYFDGFGIHQFDLLFRGSELGDILGLSLTIVWVLLITNAFNLIDGLDGLAAGSALFSTSVVLAVSFLIPNPMVTCLTIVLAGAILGFLRFNFYPASIFLGDSGSLFIGFMLSALGLAGSQKAPTMVAVAIPVVSFGLPILDVVLSVVRRFLSGKPLFAGDTDHIHHKLLKCGLSHRKAVLILYLATAGFALLSLFLMHHGEMIGLVLLVIGMGVGLGVQRLHYVEFAALQDLLRRTKKRKQVFANNLDIRRATESLKSCSDVNTICRILQETLQPIGFDGFQLESSFVRGFSELLFAPLRRTPNGGLRCSWRETTLLNPVWELRIELTARSGYRIGYFSLFRTGLEKPLLLDVDLFSYEFRSSLSGALNRAINQSPASAVREVPVPASRSAFVSSAD